MKMTGGCFFRCVEIEQLKDIKKEGMKVGIVMGSGSDRHVMDAAREVLDSFGIESEVKILSAHRTPAALEEWASSAHCR